VDVDWIFLAQYRDQQALVKLKMKFQVNLFLAEQLPVSGENLFYVFFT
jgi:hypothetical protein